MHIRFFISDFRLALLGVVSIPIQQVPDGPCSRAVARVLSDAHARAGPRLEAPLSLLIAESGRLGRAELLAKRGSIGQMQTPVELVPIPTDPLMRRESTGKLLHFGKIPKQFGQHLAKFSHTLANLKFAKFVKINKYFSNF